jgi:D-glycero-alpha-D-manno-heptose-7-phosphate kinase
MIITRTPFRISFFGGGTDYPIWYKKMGGAVIGTSIDKYCYVTTRYLPPFFDHKFRIRYTKREERNTVDDIEHPSVRECLKYLDFRQGVEMVHTSDLPAMSGLGSSSAFTVGFLNSLHNLRGETTDKTKLASEAIHIEQNLIKENVGSQDQIITAVGGLNYITFGSKGNKIIKLNIPPERLKNLENRILLFFTGFVRHASEILAEQIKNTYDRTAELAEMMSLANKAKDILCSNRNLDEFGILLDRTWQIKKKLSSKITNPYIDEIYRTARAAGALGGKLLGAGSAGFMIFYASPEKHSAIKKELINILNIPFKFENQGTQIIYKAPGSVYESGTFKNETEDPSELDASIKIISESAEFA